VSSSWLSDPEDVGITTLETSLTARCHIVAPHRARIVKTLELYGVHRVDLWPCRKPEMMTTATIKQHFARFSIAELQNNLCLAAKCTRIWRADNWANCGSIQGEWSSTYSRIKSRYKIGSLLYFVFRATAGQRSSGVSPLRRLLTDMPRLQFSELCQTRVACASFQCSICVRAAGTRIFG